VFDPTAWAFQFGLEWTPVQQRRFEQRFIGIELASEGALIEHLGKLYCFDRISEKTLKPRNEVYDHGTAYRGYRYFDLYQPPQVDQLNSDLSGNDFDIFYGLHSAITRTNRDLEPAGGWYRDQKMTPEEALRGYTVWPA
jgi:hypothetical protein